LEGGKNGSFRWQPKRGEAANPKYEYRNSKQIPNPKKKIPNKYDIVSIIVIWDCGFVSDFDIRVSDFLRNLQRCSGETSYFTPITIESGPFRCSTRVCLKPASRIQVAQSAPV